MKEYSNAPTATACSSHSSRSPSYGVGAGVRRRTLDRPRGHRRSLGPVSPPRNTSNKA